MSWYDSGGSGSFIFRRSPYVLDGFSGHADCNDLAWWFEQTGGNIESAFIVHGDPDSKDALVPVLQPFVQSPVHTSELHQTFEV